MCQLGYGLPQSRFASKGHPKRRSFWVSICAWGRGSNWKLQDMIAWRYQRMDPGPTTPSERPNRSREENGPVKRPIKGMVQVIILDEQCCGHRRPVIPTCSAGGGHLTNERGGIQATPRVMDRKLVTVLVREGHVSFARTWPWPIRSPIVSACCSTRPRGSVPEQPRAPCTLVLTAAQTAGPHARFRARLAP